MNLDFYRDIKIDKGRSFIKKFMSEILESLNKEDKKCEIENGIYQVVDFGNDTVFLQNLDDDKIFEVNNIPSEIKNQIANDYIIKYHNGCYEIDRELTDKVYNDFIDIKEYLTNKKEC